MYQYVGSVESHRIQPIERTIQVLAGEPTKVEFALQPLPVGGTVSGVVRSQSGRHRATDYVLLESIGTETQYLTTRVTWNMENGALVGRFRFEDVPEGEYQLSVKSSPFEWRQSQTKVTPPTADLELICLDGAGGLVLEFEAFDARTGKPVRGLHIAYATSSKDLSAAVDEQGSHRCSLGRFPRDVTLDWTLTSEGFVATRGDRSSFEQVGTKDGEPILRARIELTPGWGGRLRVYEKSPISDASVLCDDIEIGRTDAAGELAIALPARPRRFEVRHPDFVMHVPALGVPPEVQYAFSFCVLMKPRE